MEAVRDQRPRNQRGELVQVPENRGRTWREWGKGISETIWRIIDSAWRICATCFSSIRLNCSSSLRYYHYWGLGSSVGKEVRPRFDPWQVGSLPLVPPGKPLNLAISKQKRLKKHSIFYPELYKIITVLIQFIRWASQVVLEVKN